jgi:Bifunctional DNA primase/polymerase, N-terminal/Primase C terminal 2 (PriCT-2)
MVGLESLAGGRSSIYILSSRDKSVMNKDTRNAILDAALSYVKQRHWEVFPVPPGTKSGYSVDKHLNGNPWGKTKDEAEIRKYWARLPRANIGIPMGIGSGIFDIECDTVEGHANLTKDGAASLAELEAKHGKLPATMMFESPSGSVHRLYRHPGGDVRIRSGALDKDSYPGIDIKGDGGMSVAPPSRTRKGVYKWINRRRIAAAPQWLLDMVVKPEYAPREPDVWERFANWARLDMARLTLAMAMIPNPDCEWEEWNRVGMALFVATGGGAEGFKLFDAWSRRSRKYEPPVTSDKWTKGFGKCPPKELTAGTIFFLADEAVPDYLDRCIAQEPEVIALIEEFHKLMDAS